MKPLVITSLLATAMLGAQAETFTYTDQARVRSAEPQYENVSVPRNECRSHWISENSRGVERQERSYGGAIVGGLAGGILGHQIGGGSGKDAATALGVMLGAITGDRLDNRDQRAQYDNGQYENAQREVRRCRTVYDTQARLTGYRVTYEYRGQQFSTFMRNQPGNSLPVRVSVDPIEQ